MRSKNGGDSGTVVYMREGTISRVMAADRPYGKFFFYFYSVSPEYFGYHLVRCMVMVGIVTCVVDLTDTNRKNNISVGPSASTQYVYSLRVMTELVRYSIAELPSRRYDELRFS
jgi:hypothetical protein